MPIRERRRVRAPASGRSKRFERLRFSAERAEKFTHYFFRYPAKFHPPVAAALLAKFSETGGTIFDPFCGSGTMLVEASVAGRNSVGGDVDPLAVFVSRTKIQSCSPTALEKEVEVVLKKVLELRQKKPLQDNFLLKDLSERIFHDVVRRERLSVPEIPNLQHWFRRIVVVQLARISAIIRRARVKRSTRDFLLVAYASIIRNCSNADPAPVSGLEVTAHMKRRDAKGRQIDTLDQFVRAVRRNLAGAKSFTEASRKYRTKRSVKIMDARLPPNLGRRFDAVITSPPYHNAVDYYRRHQLEMFWLGLTATQEDRSRLLPRYIGRNNVAKRYSIKTSEELPSLASFWERKMRKVAPRRADDFLHYFWSMRKVFAELHTVLKPKGRAIFVVGDSRFGKQRIPTVDLFREMATEKFSITNIYWYPVKNRYMSYERHNDANIDKEFVLVLKRRRVSAKP